jgi:hypothetical protein
MEVEFTLTADDLAAFALYDYTEGPKGWRRFLTLFWGVVAFFTLSVIAQVVKLFLGIDAWADLMLVGAIVGALVMLRWVWWKWQPFALRRSARKLLAALDPKSRSYYEQRLKLTPEGVVQMTPLATSLIDWAAVERIVVTDLYAFIYIAPHQAYIIPERAFRNEGDFHAFADQARAFQEAAARSSAGLACHGSRGRRNGIPFDN